MITNTKFSNYFNVLKIGVVQHVAINIYNICKGHFGLGRKASKNILKDTSLIFQMTNVTILGVFRTRAQKEYKGFGNEAHLYP